MAAASLSAGLILTALVAAAPAPAPAPAATFLKGQLHLHSNGSGDSQTAPGDVVRWYASHGYDFIVFTDHNRVTAPPSTSRTLVIPGVELTQNIDDCTPPPPVAGLKCILHVNALFVTPPAGALPWVTPEPGAAPPQSRVAIYRRGLETARRLGGLAQLNHPNFHYAADAAVLTELARGGLALMEIANMSWDSNDRPNDAGRPTTESMWDAVLSSGATVYGTATDDAHDYFDAEAAAKRGEPTANRYSVGDLGFVMVRARRDPAAIREALARGDFYASTGVLLRRIDVANDQLTVVVDLGSPGRHHFDFIGRGGKVLGRADGRLAAFPLSAIGDGYVRVNVVDAKGRRAWTQPFRRATAAKR